MLILASCSPKHSENSTTSLSTTTSEQVNQPVSSNASAVSSSQLTATTAHTHSFSDPDCTNPQKCSICGLMGGAALGHQWLDATCQNAKKCSRCGETSGEKIAHDAKEGKCSMCGLDYFEELVSLIKNAPQTTVNDNETFYSYIVMLNKSNNVLLSENKKFISPTLPTPIR